MFSSFFPLMAAQRLATYLRTYRKESGLTQREVAFLLGQKKGEQFSRYEKQRVIPTLQIALACEAIFKVPVKDLFPGVSDKAVIETAALIATLRADLEKMEVQGRDARLKARKLSWIAARHGATSPSNQ